jgi:hypothetical protein
MLRFYHRINTSNMYLKFMQAHRDQCQSNDLNLIWFGCIIYPYQKGGGKQFSCSNSEGHFGAKKVLGPSAGRGERPGAVRRPWRAAWGRPPAVESGLGKSAGRGERSAAVRRPWRATWGRPHVGFLVWGDGLGGFNFVTKAF